MLSMSWSGQKVKLRFESGKSIEELWISDGPSESLYICLNSHSEVQQIKPATVFLGEEARLKTDPITCQGPRVWLSSVCQFCAKKPMSQTNVQIRMKFRHVTTHTEHLPHSQRVCPALQIRQGSRVMKMCSTKDFFMFQLGSLEGTSGSAANPESLLLKISEMTTSSDKNMILHLQIVKQNTMKKLKMKKKKLRFREF
jgi:hypothetical protein